MTVDEILELWKKDSPIDEIDLDKSSADTPKLHSKYLELLTVAKLQLKRLNLKIASLKKDKWLYYTGKMTKEDMDARDWNMTHLKVELNHLNLIWITIMILTRISKS